MVDDKYLIDAAVRILASVSDGHLDVIKLNKILFYLDLKSLLECGETVTHKDFIAIKQGPVILNYRKCLVDSMKEKGLIAVEGDTLILLNRTVFDGKFYSDEFLYVLDISNDDSFWDWYKENIGWQIAYREGLGRGRKPQFINMHLAMQQIVDDNWRYENVE